MGDGRTEVVLLWATRAMSEQNLLVSAGRLAYRYQLVAHWLRTMLTLDLTMTIVETTYSSYVMVLGSLRETALIVEAGLTGGCLPARV
jgi:hypothetical protein